MSDDDRGCQHRAECAPGKGCYSPGATTPNSAVVVAASSDVETLRDKRDIAIVETIDSHWAEVCRSLERATILDRDELVAWLREMAPHAVALGLREWWAGLPAALRVLLDGEDS